MFDLLKISIKSQVEYISSKIKNKEHKERFLKTIKLIDASNSNTMADYTNAFNHVFWSFTVKPIQYNYLIFKKDLKYETLAYETINDIVKSINKRFVYGHSKIYLGMFSDIKTDPIIR